VSSGHPDRVGGSVAAAGFCQTAPERGTADGFDCSAITQTNPEPMATGRARWGRFTGHQAPKSLTRQVFYLGHLHHFTTVAA
jgi:hypothetical protein